MIEIMFHYFILILLLSPLIFSWLFLVVNI
jgi:hypothetical protein